MERNLSLNLDSIGTEQGRVLLSFLQKTVKQDATHGVRSYCYIMTLTKSF
jgi:hypothetical protein